VLERNMDCQGLLQEINARKADLAAAVQGGCRAWFIKICDSSTHHPSNEMHSVVAPTCAAGSEHAGLTTRPEACQLYNFSGCH
jgi:hypothetical protein